MFSYFITHSTFRDGIVKKEMIYCFWNSYNCSTLKNSKVETKTNKARASNNYGDLTFKKIINFKNMILHVRVCIAQSIINSRMDSLESLDARRKYKSNYFFFHFYLLVSFFFGQLLRAFIFHLLRGRCWNLFHGILWHTKW